MTFRSWTGIVITFGALALFCLAAFYPAVIASLEIWRYHSDLREVAERGIEAVDWAPEPELEKAGIGLSEIRYQYFKDETDPPWLRIPGFGRQIHFESHAKAILTRPDQYQIRYLPDDPGTSFIFPTNPKATFAFAWSLGRSFVYAIAILAFGLYIWIQSTYKQRKLRQTRLASQTE